MATATAAMADVRSERGVVEESGDGVVLESGDVVCEEDPVSGDEVWGEAVSGTAVSGVSKRTA